MKTKIATLFMVLLLSACAVNIPADQMVEMSTGNDGRVYYEEVVNVDSLSAKEIYDKALIWMARNYVSSSDVIQIKDENALMIIGRGGSQVYDMFGQAHPTSHMIRFDARDQRYRVRFYDFYVYKNPLEDIAKTLPTYLEQERALIKSRTTSLKQEINTNSNNDSW